LDTKDRLIVVAAAGTEFKGISVHGYHRLKGRRIVSNLTSDVDGDTMVVHQVCLDQIWPSFCGLTRQIIVTGKQHWTQETDEDPKEVVVHTVPR
jgi:hypothetical protein